MTKKTVGYVHLEWECPACGTRNKGVDKICRNCGAAQPDDVQFEQVAQESLIQDEKLIAQAAAGPDVHCPFCGTRNPATASQCSQCLADLTEAKAREAGQVVGAHQKKAVPDVACTHCGAMNPGTAQQCSQCGAVLPKLDRPKPAAARPQVRRATGMSRTARFVLFGILGLFAIACMAIIVLSSRTEEIVGEVQGVSWETAVMVQALVPVELQDWGNELPNNADVISCRQELRRTQSNPAPGANEVCGTPYTVDTGTGVGEVVQDCVYEIYDELCTYTELQWHDFDLVSLTGDDFEPRWPNPALAQDQRLGESTEQYEVYFWADGASYTYRPDDVNEFSQFDDGSRWILEVNALGNVRSVTPDR
ncbi:zinc-ribbon domain-containing protein [Candidatus Leptofilum sp.]|uniref:zinc-ribbon domain-containing protein n=1 Tax=Candidatus Leptofilum sp. TaxID=3241576 RepID=UPI003B5A245E